MRLLKTLLTPVNVHPNHVVRHTGYIKCIQLYSNLLFHLRIYISYFCTGLTSASVVQEWHSGHLAICFVVGTWTCPSFVNDFANCLCLIVDVGDQWFFLWTTMTLTCPWNVWRKPLKMRSSCWVSRHIPQIYFNHWT